MSRDEQAAAYALLSAAAKVQTVSAIGRPGDAYVLGARALDRHVGVLRRLADV